MPKKKSTRRKDGRYQAKSHGKYFYSTISQADADRKAAVYRKQIQDGLHQDARKITVAQYAADWLPLHKAHVSDRVYNDYAALMDKVLRVIGSVPCISVRPDDAKRVFVEAFPPKKSSTDRSGYSGSTIKKVRMLCVDLFESAIDNGLCTRNPFRAKSAKPEYGEDGSHREITEAERDLILSSDHWFKPAVMVMLYAGLRRGEALAVDLDRDVDSTLSWLTIRHAVRFDVNRPVLDDPKTESGKRTVPIFLPLRPYLTGRGLLVPARHSGREMSESAFRSAWDGFVLSIECKMNGVSQKRWYGLDRAAKVRDPHKYWQVIDLINQGRKEEADALRLSDWKTFSVRPHDLRHTFCTMCRDAGVDIKQTMLWMGHSDTQMILRIYDHPGAQRAADSIEKVQKNLSPGAFGRQNGRQAT